MPLLPFDKWKDEKWMRQTLERFRQDFVWHSRSQRSSQWKRIVQTKIRKKKTRDDERKESEREIEREGKINKFTWMTVVVCSGLSTTVLTNNYPLRKMRRNASIISFEWAFHSSLCFLDLIVNGSRCWRRDYFALLSITDIFHNINERKMMCFNSRNFQSKFLWNYLIQLEIVTHAKSFQFP